MKITISYRYVAGIDISKQKLDVYLFDQKLRQGRHLQVVNNSEGFACLANWLTDHHAFKKQTLLCSEHTGRYAERLLRWTTENGWPHSQLKTTALKKVGNEHHRKTDGYDARMLAEYGCRYMDRLPLKEAPKKIIQQLKRLRKTRRKMVDQRGSVKQQIGEADYHDADMNYIINMWSQQKQQLSAHIKQLETKINQCIAENPSLYKRYRQMRKAPGVGPVVGNLLVTLFAGKQELNASKICSQYGFAPHPHRSGSSVRKSDRSSGYGNGEIRRLLHLAARSVATHCDHYSHYYKRKEAEGKPPYLIYNNIINKLIHLYCTLWNKRTTYDPEHMRRMENKFKKSA